MLTTDTARRDQATSADPHRAIRLLEAHLDQRLADWQRDVMVAMLTPSQQWFGSEAGGGRSES